MPDVIYFTQMERLQLRLANAEYLLEKERLQKLLSKAVLKRNCVIDAVCLPHIPQHRFPGDYCFDLDEGYMTYKGKEDGEEGYEQVATTADVVTQE